jgi:hypothetical protein
MYGFSRASRSYCSAGLSPTEWSRSASARRASSRRSATAPNRLHRKQRARATEQAGLEARTRRRGFRASDADRCAQSAPF